MLNEALSGILSIVITVIIAVGSAPNLDASELLLVTCGDKILNDSGQEVNVGFNDGRKRPLTDQFDSWQVYYVCTVADNLDGVSLSDLERNSSKSAPISHGTLSPDMITGLIIGSVLVLTIVLALLILNCLRNKWKRSKGTKKRSDL